MLQVLSRTNHPSTGRQPDHVMALFLVHASGAYGSWRYIQEATSKEGAASICRSTYAKVISVKEATCRDVEQYGAMDKRSIYDREELDDLDMNDDEYNLLH